jgi:hypothetical protein
MSTGIVSDAARQTTHHSEIDLFGNRDYARPKQLLATRIIFLTLTRRGG